MTDPTPQTTPTRDEAVLLPCPFCGSPAEIERYGDSGKSTIYQCTSCSCSLETGEEWDHGRDWNKRASAPAPASGGVDAAFTVASNLLRDGCTYADRKTAADFIRSALSPAATPVSEAGGEAVADPADVRKAAAPFVAIADGYADAEDDTHEIWIDAAERWTRITLGQCRALREALAKPASSPAGDKRDALVRAVKRAMENAGTLPAKEAVKLVPADWHRVCDLVLGASQSTSAGRVGE